MTDDTREWFLGQLHFLLGKDPAQIRNRMKLAELCPNTVHESTLINMLNHGLMERGLGEVLKWGKRTSVGSALRRIRQAMRN